MTNSFITLCSPQLKWRQAHKEKPINFSPSCTYTPDTDFTVTWKLPMHGAHYHLISIQSSQLKLYRGCISLPELGAICRPLSSYLYQWRCFWGEHLGLRRQSMKWNAPGSPSAICPKRAKRYLNNMHNKERVSTGCDKLVRDLNKNRKLQMNDTKFTIQATKMYVKLRI